MSSSDNTKYNVYYDGVVYGDIDPEVTASELDEIMRKRKQKKAQMRRSPRTEQQVAPGSSNYAPLTQQLQQLQQQQPYPRQQLQQPQQLRQHSGCPNLRYLCSSSMRSFRTFGTQTGKEFRAISTQTDISFRQYDGDRTPQESGTQTPLVTGSPWNQKRTGLDKTPSMFSLKDQVKQNTSRMLLSPLKKSKVSLVTGLPHFEVFEEADFNNFSLKVSEGTSPGLMSSPSLNVDGNTSSRNLKSWKSISNEACDGGQPSSILKPEKSETSKPNDPDSDVEGGQLLEAKRSLKFRSSTDVKEISSEDSKVLDILPEPYSYASIKDRSKTLYAPVRREELSDYSSSIIKSFSKIRTDILSDETKSRISPSESQVFLIRQHRLSLKLSEEDLTDENSSSIKSSKEEVLQVQRYTEVTETSKDMHPPFDADTFKDLAEKVSKAKTSFHTPTDEKFLSPKTEENSFLESSPPSSKLSTITEVEERIIEEITTIITEKTIKNDDEQLYSSEIAMKYLKLLEDSFSDNEDKAKDPTVLYSREEDLNKKEGDISSSSIETPIQKDSNKTEEDNSSDTLIEEIVIEKIVETYSTKTVIITRGEESSLTAAALLEDDSTRTESEVPFEDSSKREEDPSHTTTAAPPNEEGPDKKEKKDSSSTKGAPLDEVSTKTEEDSSYTTAAPLDESSTRRVEETGLEKVTVKEVPQFSSEKNPLSKESKLPKEDSLESPSDENWVKDETPQSKPKDSPNATDEASPSKDNLTDEGGKSKEKKAKSLVQIAPKTPTNQLEELKASLEDVSNPSKNSSSGKDSEDSNEENTSQTPPETSDDQLQPEPLPDNEKPKEKDNFHFDLSNLSSSDFSDSLNHFNFNWNARLEPNSFFNFKYHLKDQKTTELSATNIQQQIQPPDHQSKEKQDNDLISFEDVNVSPKHETTPNSSSHQNRVKFSNDVIKTALLKEAKDLAEGRQTNCRGGYQTPASRSLETIDVADLPVQPPTIPNTGFDAVFFGQKPTPTIWHKFDENYTTPPEDQSEDEDQNKDDHANENDHDQKENQIGNSNTNETKVASEEVKTENENETEKVDIISNSSEDLLHANYHVPSEDDDNDSIPSSDDTLTPADSKGLLP